MSNFDELIKKDHVRNHPLIKKSLKSQMKFREALEKQSQAMEDYRFLDEDGICTSNSTLCRDYNQGKDLNSMIFAAAMVAQDVMSQFDLPLPPEISYNNAKNVKYARGDQDVVVEGNILFNVGLRTVTGMKTSAVLAIPISRGEVYPPSTIDYDGRTCIISQHVFDEIVERNTFYEKLPYSDQFSSPMDLQEKELNFDYRNDIGYAPTFDRDPYTFTASKKEAAKPKMVPAAYPAVKELLEKAEKENIDNFPRPWDHILRNYILEVVSEADMDRWLPFLINDGFAINVFDTNRGRGRKKAQEAPNNQPPSPPMSPPSEGPGEAPGGSQEDITKYPGTKTPIEIGDKVKFEGQEGPIHGEIMGAEGSDLLVESAKGKTYKVPLTNLKPLPSTFKKMYLASKDAQQQLIMPPDDGLQQDETTPDMQALKKFYSGTKMPIDLNDKIRFTTHQGDIRADVCEVNPDDDYIIVKSKGIMYKVHVEDVTPMPKVYEKMWKEAPVEEELTTFEDLEEGI